VAWLGLVWVSESEWVSLSLSLSPYDLLGEERESELVGCENIIKPWAHFINAKKQGGKVEWRGTIGVIHLTKPVLLFVFVFRLSWLLMPLIDSIMAVAVLLPVWAFLFLVTCKNLCSVVHIHIVSPIQYNRIECNSNLVGSCLFIAIALSSFPLLNRRKL